jgi:hypothetical protein
MKRLGAAGLAFWLATSVPLPARAHDETLPAAPATAADTTAPEPVAVPVAPAPAPAAVAPAAAAPVASSRVATAPAGQLAVSPGHALVHLAVNYRDAWLETRQYVDGGAFARTCAAPCDVQLNVQGLQARVVAPGMTPSNAFRFDGGSGAAGVRVDGGSATARTIGIITLAAGIPVALGGMALFGLGKLQHKAGLEAAGIAGLSLGGVSIGVSIPLLLIGTTRVKSANGTRIASSFALSAAAQ